MFNEKSIFRYIYIYIDIYIYKIKNNYFCVSESGDSLIALDNPIITMQNQFLGIL